jgi:hypothetical protein
VDDTLRSEATDRLLTAYRTREPIDPLTATYEGMTLDDAYAIQLAQVDALTSGSRGEGPQDTKRTVKGHKVGLTSIAMQRLLGVDEPDFGHLLDDYFHLEHAPIPMGAFLQPRIEPEVAFVLRADAARTGRDRARGDRGRRLRPAGARDRRLPDPGLEDRPARHDRRQRQLRRGRPRLDAHPAARGRPAPHRRCHAQERPSSSAPAPGVPSSARRSTPLVWLANTLGARVIARGRPGRPARARSAPWSRSPPATPSPPPSPASGRSPPASSDPYSPTRSRTHVPVQGHRRHRRPRQHRHRPDVQADAPQRHHRAALHDRCRPGQRRAAQGRVGRSRGQPRGGRLAARAGRAAGHRLRVHLGQGARGQRPPVRGGRHPRRRPHARGGRPVRLPSGQRRLQPRRDERQHDHLRRPGDDPDGARRRRRRAMSRTRRSSPRSRASRPDRAPAPTSTSSPRPPPRRSRSSAAPSGARRSSSSTRSSRRS